MHWSRHRERGGLCRAAESLGQGECSRELQSIKYGYITGFLETQDLRLEFEVGGHHFSSYHSLSGIGYTLRAPIVDHLRL